MLHKVFILLLGVFACSTAVVWIKTCTIDPLLLAAYRLLGAGIVLSPLFFRDLRHFEGGFTRSHLLRCLLPALMLSTHFITWIMGARMTWAANATLSVNMVPIAMPFVIYVMMRERVTRGEIIGTMISMGGVAVLWIDSYEYSIDYLWGDIICMISMLLFTINLALSRHNRDFASIWLYVVPVYLLAGLIGLLIAWPFSGLTQTMGMDNWLALAGIIAVPTLLGHTLLTWALKHLHGQLVSIVNLAQFIFAAIMGAVFLNEIPGSATYIAGALVIAGAIVVIMKSQPGQENEPDSS